MYCSDYPSVTSWWPCWLRGRRIADYITAQKIACADVEGRGAARGGGGDALYRPWPCSSRGQGERVTLRRNYTCAHQSTDAI